MKWRWCVTVASVSTSFQHSFSPRALALRSEPKQYGFLLRQKSGFGLCREVGAHQQVRASEGSVLSHATATSSRQASRRSGVPMDSAQPTACPGSPRRIEPRHGRLRHRGLVRQSCTQDVAASESSANHWAATIRAYCTPPAPLRLSQHPSGCFVWLVVRPAAKHFLHGNLAGVCVRERCARLRACPDCFARGSEPPI